MNTDLTSGYYRRIYAGFLTGKRINSVSMAAEAWFWRLHAIADDFGNLHGDPTLIWKAASGRREIPLKQTEAWTKEILDAGLAYAYCRDEDYFIHLIDFEDKQPAGRNGKRIQKCPRHPDSQPLQVNPGESGGIQNNPGESQSIRKIQADHTHTHTHTHNHTHKQTTPPSPKGVSAEWSSFSLLLPDPMRTDAVKASWESWVEYRGKKLKPSTLKVQAKKLTEFGHDGAIASIEQSIGNSWQGLFPARSDSGRATKPRRDSGEYQEPAKALPRL